MAQSILNPKEVSRARFGPRAVKNPYSREYAIQTIHSLKRLLDAMELDQKRIEEELQLIKKYQHWKILGYEDEDKLLEAECGFTREKINRKIKEQTKQAEQQGALAKHGEIGGGHSRDNHIMSDKQGTSSSYLCRRMMRDRKDIFDDLKSGKYPSVRAAAKEAGIVKDPTPYQLLIRAWNKASELERKRFINFIKERS